MTENDYPEFAMLLAGEVELRNGKTLSEAAMVLWWERMQRFELEQVKRAFAAYGADAERGRWMPMPTDLIRHIEGTHTDRSLLAWGVVIEAMSSVGAYSDVDFGDPAVHAAIRDLGGWPKLCRTELKELPFAQRRFTEAFRAYSERGVAECPLQLMGDRSPDVEYEKKGLPPPTAKLLGARPCADVMAERKHDAIGHEAARALLDFKP